MVTQAQSIIKDASLYFRTSDWLKELSGKQVTSNSRADIIAILYNKVKLYTLDEESGSIMEELVKLERTLRSQNNNFDFEDLKSRIVKKCYDDQRSDLTRMRFLFKYSSTVIMKMGKDSVLKEFSDILFAKRRDTWQERDIAKELASNAKCFIREFDQNGEVFMKCVTKKIFKRDLSESDQVTTLEAICENGLSIRYPWKRALADWVKSHSPIEEVERVAELVERIDPFIIQIAFMKKYFTDRMQYFYVSIFEKLRVKIRFCQILRR